MSRALRRLAAAAAALVAVAAIAGTTVSAFAGSTSNPGNTFAAAASWGCTSPGTVTASANIDSWIDQASPTSNFGSDQILKLKRETGSKAMRALLRFTLPAVPAGCAVTGATLRVYAASAATGQTLQALRNSATWTENGVTWNNQPATAGTAATTTSVSGWNQWTVTSLVQAMYSGSNFGFKLRFATETSPVAEMQFHARNKGSEHPELRITFG
jgi:large repetitive protein